MNDLTKILLVALSVFLLGCYSAEELLTAKAYDAALLKSLQRLEKKPNDHLAISILKESYSEANANSLKQIEVLKDINTAESWERIVWYYEQVDKRNSILNSRGYSSSVTILDVSEQKNESRKIVARLYEEKAHDALRLADKSNYRQAFSALMKSRNYGNSKPEIDSLIAKTKELGTNYVLFQIRPNPKATIPEDLAQQIMTIDLKSRSSWEVIHKRPNSGTLYDYSMEIVFNEVFYEPERLTKSKYSEEKTKIVGQKTLKDANGKTVKDKNGKPVMVNVTKKVEAEVQKFTVQKELKVSYDWYFTDLVTGNIISSAKLYARENFSYEWATFKGDQFALSERSRVLVKRGPKKTPSDRQMIRSVGKRIAREVSQDFRQLEY